MQRSSLSIFLAVLMTAVVALGVRWGLGFQGFEPTWDEAYMQPLVERIVDAGWTVSTLIDYDDTKGPVFFVVHAAAAEILGADLPSLRLMSIVFFSLSAAPLLVLAWRAGLTAGHRWWVLALYVTLPYNLLLAQLFMSEPSFNFGALALILLFVWALTREDENHRSITGPIVVGLALAILLHHRAHAVVFAAAIAITTLQRLGWRCWPWWLACLLAGVTRLPLYLRWDGLVGPSYQDRYGLGWRLDSLTYLLMSLLPYMIPFLILQVGRHALGRRHVRWWLMTGGVVGLLLGLVATPQNYAPRAGDAEQWQRYLGMTWTMLNLLAPAGLVREGIILMWSTAGGVALASFALLSLGPDEGDAPDQGLMDRESAAAITIDRLAAWIILIGWALHAFTRGDVFDRYFLPFVLLLPIVWRRHLPRPLLLFQLALLITITILSLSRWA